jgi:predicted acetyltransferase
MDLEKLKIQYNFQLNAYKQAVANYVNYLQQNENAQNSAPNYVTIPGKAFWGSGQAGTQSVYNANTTQQCQALCAKTSNCTGATFNPDVNGEAMCWLRTGEGQVVPALDSDVSIIPEAQKYMLRIESINKKLISTNQQIQNIINQSQPVYNSMQTEGQEKNKELIQNYMQLVVERERIAEVLKSYEDLDKTEQQGEMKVTQKQYSYILLVIVAVGVMVLLYKFSGVLTSESGSSQSYNQTGGELPQSTYYVL